MWRRCQTQSARNRTSYNSWVILNDPFLGKRLEEGNLSTVPLRDEFLENAHLFIFETLLQNRSTYRHECLSSNSLTIQLLINSSKEGMIEMKSMMSLFIKKHVDERITSQPWNLLA